MLFLPSLRNLRHGQRRPQNPPVHVWCPKTLSWQYYLMIDGTTYTVPQLFDVDPTPKVATPASRLEEGAFVDSPAGNWRYSEVNMPAGTHLDTWCGAKRGEVVFTTDVLIPRIHRANRRGKQPNFSYDPIMSFTPAELFSMRTGRTHARQHTVIAGLGMGYLLRIVAAKRTVKKITLVELDEDIVNWILPVLRAEVEKTCELEVVIGDARQIVPTLEADSALVDIADSYGGNTFPHCPHINKVWVWGA